MSQRIGEYLSLGLGGVMLALGIFLSTPKSNELNHRPLQRQEVSKVETDLTKKPAFFSLPHKEISKVEQKTFSHFEHVDAYDRLESKVEQTIITKKLKTFPHFEHVDAYDGLIQKLTEYWNAKFKDLPGYEPLDPNLVKSIIISETGSLADKDTFKYDPMQIANKGDFALDELQSGTRLNRLVKDEKYFEKYKKIMHTPRNRGKWDYQAVPAERRINAELSIEGGILFLYYKFFKYNNKGEVVGAYGWRKAVERYGPGRPEYAEKIFARLR